MKYSQFLETKKTIDVGDEKSWGTGLNETFSVDGACAAAVRPGGEDGIGK